MIDQLSNLISIPVFIQAPDNSYFKNVKQIDQFKFFKKWGSYVDLNIDLIKSNAVPGQNSDNENYQNFYAFEDMF